MEWFFKIWSEASINPSRNKSRFDASWLRCNGANYSRGIFPIAALWVILACPAQAGKITYIYTDAQGSPLAETDEQGNITASFDYKPYGSQAYGSPTSGPGYTGHVSDADIGMIYMQSRYYDPLLARFIGIDPINPTPGDVFNFNRFVYANNNSYRYIDPDGKQVDRTQDEILRRQSFSCQSDPACAYALSDDKKSSPIDPVPVTHALDPAVPEGGYDTPMSAGTAGVRAAGQVSQGKFEYGGVVLEKIGHYWYTVPVTSEESRGFAVTYNPPSNGYSWAQMSFHTHPYGLRSLTFSPRDVNYAVRNGWTTIVGFFEDKSIRYFDPATMRIGVRQADRYGLSQGAEAAKSAEGRVLCERCFP